MEPKGWRNWKEIPYRGQPESKTYKSNKPINFSKIEEWVNIISILFFGTLSLLAIFFTIRSYHTHATDNILALTIVTITVVMFTVAIMQGIMSTLKHRRKSRVKKKNRDSKD